MFTLIYKPGCKTCQKAIELLDARGVEYALRDVGTNRPDAEELRAWHKLSGAPLTAFWNTEEPSFRSLRVFTSSRMLSTEQQYLIMTADANLITHPIFVGDDFILVGFTKTAWERRLPERVE